MGGEGELSRKEEGIKWMEFCFRKASPLPRFNTFQDSSGLFVFVPEPLFFFIC